MKDKYPFVLLGNYINELMQRFDLNDKDLCDKIKIGNDTFDNIKKGMDMKLGYYFLVFEFLRRSIPANKFKEVFLKLNSLFMELTRGDDYPTEA